MLYFYPRNTVLESCIRQCTKAAADKIPFYYNGPPWRKGCQVSPRISVEKTPSCNIAKKNSVKASFEKP